MAAKFVESISSGSSENEDTRSCVGISITDFIGIKFETLAAYELFKSEVEEFLDELKSFLKLLEENKDSIDKNYMRTKKITVAGSTISAVGGGLVIAGTAAAPATLGVTLSLSAFGGALIVTGTTASAYSQYKGSNERKGYLEDCMERAKELEVKRDEIKKLERKYREKCRLLAEAVQTLIITNTSFQLDEIMLKHILMGLQASDHKAIGATIIKAAAITPVANASHLLSSTANSICAIVREAGPAIAIASKVTFHLGVALGSIGVFIDIVIGTMALVNIVSKTKCQESITLTRNIEKAKGIITKVQGYYDRLLKEPQDLFIKADEAIKENTKQIEQEYDN